MKSKTTNEETAEIARLRRKLAREVNARQEAEKLLEEKSAELFDASEQLKEEVQQVKILHAAVDTSRDGIALTNATGVFSYMNSAHASMFGYSVNELIGQPWSVLYGNAELDRFNDSIMPDFQENGYWHGETYGLTKAGETIIQDVVLTGLADGGLICATRDISARRKRELQAREIETRLVKAEREAELYTLGNAVAHDFNNLLAAISGNAVLLKMDLQEDPDNYYRANQIEIATTQAAKVIQTLERERSNDTVLKEDTDLVELMKTGLQIAQAIKPNGVRITTNLPSAAIVHLNQVLLTRCLLNIVRNAFEAMGEDGKLDVTIAKSPSKRLKGCDTPYLLGNSGLRYSWILEITDTGCGIEPQKLERIFSSFFTTKTDIGGSGLGLQSLESLVESGVVDVEVETSLNAGTRFRLKFLEQEKSSTFTLQKNTAPQSHSNSECKIMLVDDNELVGRVMLENLERLGFETTWFQSPSQAIEEFNANPDIANLVITDLTMPEISGEDLAKTIKKLAPEIPIVIYSGQAGFIENSPIYANILKKPIAPEKLKMVIQELMDNNQ